MTTEIFRHLRPYVVDESNMKLAAHSMGGLSFLLRPVDKGVYNFWVYMCPASAMFSSRQAVKSLRNRADSGVVPYGTIPINDSPLIEQLVDFICSNSSLPSEVPGYVSQIRETNQHAEAVLNAIQHACKGTINEYKRHTIR